LPLRTPAPEGVTTHIVFEARLRPLGLWVSGAKWLLFLHTAVPQYYGMKGVSIIIPIITTKCFVFAIFFDLMFY